MAHGDQIGEVLGKVVRGGHVALVKTHMDAWNRQGAVREKLGSKKAESTGEHLD